MTEENLNPDILIDKKIIFKILNKHFIIYLKIFFVFILYCLFNILILYFFSYIIIIYLFLFIIFLFFIAYLYIEILNIELDKVFVVNDKIIILEKT
jgi:hypothetical protein